MRKIVIGFIVLVVLLVVLARIFTPAPSPPPLRLHAGQTLKVTLIQTIVGKASAQRSQPLDGNYTIHETYLVKSVAPNGDITIQVTVLDITGQSANGPVQTQVPDPWQFTIDQQYRLLSGNVWPLVGNNSVAPFADDFCLPLETTFKSNSKYPSPITIKRTGAQAPYMLDVTVGAFAANQPISLSGQGTYKYTSTELRGAVTVTSNGTVTKNATCIYDPRLGRPLSEQSQVTFSTQQIFTLSGGTQSTTTSGTITTSIVYSAA